MSSPAEESIEATKKRKISVKEEDSSVPVVHHTFDPSDEPIAPKKPKKTETPAPKKPATETVAAPTEKKSDDVQIIKFQDVDTKLFRFDGVTHTPKNKAKNVIIHYGNGNELFVTPPMYVGYGFFKNDMSYNISASFLGVDPMRNITPEGTAVVIDEENADLVDRVACYDKCFSFDDYLLNLAVERSPEWFGRQITKDKLKLLYRPLATPNVDKFDDEKRYPSTIKFTIPIAEDGSTSFKFFNKGTKEDLDPDTYLNKELKSWAKFGFTIKKVTFPTSGKYKFGVQVIAHQMMLIKTNSTKKFAKTDNALE